MNYSSPSFTVRVRHVLWCMILGWTVSFVVGNLAVHATPLSAQVLPTQSENKPILPSSVNAYLNAVPYTAVLEQATTPATQTVTYGAATAQFYQVWSPHPQQPLLVFIHGGCWLSAFDIQHTYGLMRALAEQGFTVVGLEYRRSGETGGGWPVTLEDVQAGLAHILQHVEYDRTETVNLLGHSAGGHLALLASMQGNASWSNGRSIAVHSLAGIVNFEQYYFGKEDQEGTSLNSCQKAAAQFATPEIARSKAINPIQQSFASKMSQVILWSGSADNIVAEDQAWHPQANIKSIKGAGHFDFVHAQSQAWQQIMQTLKESL